METGATTSDEAQLRSVGGHVALDLVNSDVFAQDDRSVDVLRSPAEFRAWCASNAVPVPRSAEAVDAPALTAQAARLRAAMRAVVEAIAAARTVPPDALTTLRSMYVDAVARSAPVLDGGRLRWEQDATTSSAAVAHLTVAAVDLLREGPTDRIKVCPSCGFVFLDLTKNRSRRWCSMEDCGKQEKMRRYVAKRARARSR
jgi:predicted RNA-binding Zn ribbon-like protein